jgi:hypothetical protein
MPATLIKELPLAMQHSAMLEAAMATNLRKLIVFTILFMFLAMTAAREIRAPRQWRLKRERLLEWS